MFTFVEVAGERKVFWITFFVRPNGPVRMDDAETTADDKRITKRRRGNHRAAVDGERIAGKQNSEIFILFDLSALSYKESGTSHVASVGYVSRRWAENVPLSPLSCRTDKARKNYKYKYTRSGVRCRTTTGCRWALGCCRSCVGRSTVNGVSRVRELSVPGPASIACPSKNGTRGGPPCQPSLPSPPIPRSTTPVHTLPCFNLSLSSPRRPRARAHATRGIDRTFRVRAIHGVHANALV